jgi:uncharacterized protein (TIGR01319 family)
MEAILLIDFGSTNTKVTAVQVPAVTALSGTPEKAAGKKAVGNILGTAATFTTVATDIGEGLALGLELLQQQTGPLHIVERFACSSAAGGLRMVTCGLVPSLTAEAARLASLGAGAKVTRVFSYELTEEDVAEIGALNPDILLLTGGVDGGNRDCIIHNAKMLASLPPAFPVLIAGNRNAAAECEKILAGRELIRCPNVMPKLGELNIEPVQKEIRELFLRRIIQAKGLSREQELISGILMPTPSAVKRALELLAKGTAQEPGLGELVAVDLGGATTDVYSVARGLPQKEDVILKGLVEPESKRTVEGDIGMRYSAVGVLEALGAERLAALSGLDPAALESRVSYLNTHPEVLPLTAEERALDFALAAGAIETAVCRHAGTIEQVYTPTGPAFLQTGKDLTTVSRFILTGGALIHNERAADLAAFGFFNKAAPGSLRPHGPEVLIDCSYILAAMGLLAESHPDAALSIMKASLGQ